MALAVVESVSGVPPEVADTVVGTLMARAEMALSVDDSMAALRGPLERCGRLEPGDRPESGELVITLLATAETMPRPAGFPLTGLVVEQAAAETGDDSHDGEPSAGHADEERPAPVDDAAREPIGEEPPADEPTVGGDQGLVSSRTERTARPPTVPS